MSNFKGNEMNINEYDDANFDDDSYLETGISGFEIAYGSKNKIAIKQKVKKKLEIKRRLDSLEERRRLSREIDTLYGEFQH